MFKATYLDCFVPREMRGEKVTEFINLYQGGKSFYEFTLEFVKLSKHAPSLVSDRRDQMSHIVMGVSEDIKEDCQSVMLHDTMNISRLIIY